ncbi:MAG: hypothetical protein H7Y36_10415 [Armatimonadetes bacterium]|nr:hypothetical protein [Akkermansiaceae bacterium]
MIWGLTHHQECRYSESPEGKIDEVLHALAGSTHGHLTSGNAVRLIQNEAFFHEVTAEMDRAKSSLHFETFLWICGEASEIILTALENAARRGVKVRVLVDARGSGSMTQQTRERLKDSGCIVAWYHRWTPNNLGRFNLRDHRKIIVLDGQIAFVGGHCIADEWFKDTDKSPRYRDITARLTGPVVASIQTTFSENWNEVTDELFVDDTTFPELTQQGEVLAHVASIRPDGCPSSVQVLHYLVIALAKERIRIQNPYFLPDPVGSKALVAAARRGVDVRIMAPSPHATDSPYVSYAGHFLYQRMLEGGVRIYEYEATLLHQKIITIDGKWCGIGSSNFDDRSFEINDEITVGIADPAIVSELDETFENDLEKCSEKSLEEWKKRPVWKRCVDGIYYLFNEQF